MKQFIRRITAIILALSAAVFFLPYRGQHTALAAIVDAFNTGQSDWGVEFILRFVLPVVFTLIAALFMVLRFKVIRCVIAVIFSGLALCVYFSFFGEYARDSIGVSIGLILNLVIAILGVILPIVIIVLEKTNKLSKKV